MTETLDLRIDSIAAGGDGVGRHAGMVVFVPRTAPGDLVRVAAERRDRLMRGTVIEVLEPSPLRTRPECAHYVDDRCGGCQLQHLDYAAQLDAKSTIVRDALARIGRLAVERPGVEASPKPWRYRRKLTLKLRPTNAGWVAGLHRYDAPAEIFPLRDCPISEAELVAAWKTLLEHQSLLPRARELRGAVRALGDGYAFALEGGRAWPDAAAFFDRLPLLRELWWQPQDRNRRLLHSRETGARAGASFVQVNPAMAAALRAWVVARAASHRPRTAIDGYAGTGDVAVELARLGTRVVAIEIDRDAARLAGSRLPSGSRSVAAPVEDALERSLPADVIVLNPPRAGLHARVAALLADHAARAAGQLKAIVYVSCNPATLARDLARMASLEIRSLRAFDMFPQTAHVETVCELTPAAA